MLSKRPELCFRRKQPARVLPLRVSKRGTWPLGRSRLYRKMTIVLTTFIFDRAVCTGTAPASAPTNRPTAPVSFVPNSYFSFPYAPTDFGDREACTSAVSACSRNYEACTSGLQGGGGFAVTIDVPGGGGTTVGAGVNLGASATSVCSSLSSQACRDLEPTSCETLNSASTRIRASASSAVFFAVAASAMFASVFLC